MRAFYRRSNFLRLQLLIIAETANMTIHPIRLTGLIVGVSQVFEYLDKMQERIIDFVSSHSRVSKEKFKELMFNNGTA